MDFENITIAPPRFAVLVANKIVWNVLMIYVLNVVLQNNPLVKNIPALIKLITAMKVAWNVIINLVVIFAKSDIN